MSERNESPSGEPGAEFSPPPAGETSSAAPERSGKWSAAAVDKVLEATIANPVRLVVAGVLAANPGTSYTGYGLVRKINAAQTPDSTGQLGENDAPNVFRQAEDLAGAGLARVGHNPETSTTRIKVTKKGKAYGPAVGGALVGWQQRHPELPLSDIVGSSNREAATHDSTRGSAMVRLAVVELASRGENLSQAQIAQNLGERSQRVGVALQSLEGQGIINVERQSPQSTVIIDPSKQSSTGKATSLAGRAVRQTVKNIAEQNTAEGTGESGVISMTQDEFVQRVKTVDPTLSSYDIWKYTVKACSKTDRD